jgi:hypothetical protein
MPSLTRRSFQQVLHHAQAVKRHGKAFEEMAKSLEGRLLSREQAALIECTGQEIQQHGQIMITLAALALQNESYSVEEYELIHRHQHQVVLLHIAANLVAIKAMHLSNRTAQGDVVDLFQAGRQPENEGLEFTFP